MYHNNIRFIDALVVRYSQRSDAFYAFASGFANDIIIDACYCPKNDDILGKWVKIGIDHRNRAREVARVIGDKFMTRIVNGLVEYCR